MSGRLRLLSVFSPFSDSFTTFALRPPTCLLADSLLRCNSAADTVQVSLSVNYAASSLAVHEAKCVYMLRLFTIFVSLSLSIVWRRRGGLFCSLLAWQLYALALISRFLFSMLRSIYKFQSKLVHKTKKKFVA